MADWVPLRALHFLRLGFVLMIFLLPALSVAEEAQSELIHFYQFKPTYFLMGTPYTKIEFSFKADVIRSVPLYFGYTQLMFWELFVQSPYFYDIDYNPEVF